MANALEGAAEAVNLTYAISIVFCTTTITIVSYQRSTRRFPQEESRNERGCRWIDVHQVRVGGVRPLDCRHWIQIGVFTSIATAVIASNKAPLPLLLLLLPPSLRERPGVEVVYMHLKQERDSELLQTFHTLTQMAIILIWIIIFIACTLYNLRIIQIGASLHLLPFYSSQHYLAGHH